jgi:hypothetical protein
MSLWRSLGRDERGSVLIIAALMGSLIAGFVGLGVDVAMLYYTRESMQNAADNAAVAAAYAYSAGNTSGYLAEGRASTAAVGFVHGQKGVSVNVVTPPTQGAMKGKSGYFEATISQTYVPVFMGLVMPGNWTTPIAARAVATTGQGTGKGVDCMLSLTTVILNSGANVNLGTCGMAADGTGAQSVLLNSGSKITASDVTTPEWPILRHRALTSTLQTLFPEAAIRTSTSMRDRRRHFRLGSITFRATSISIADRA